MKSRINLTWFLAMIVIFVGISNAAVQYDFEGGVTGFTVNGSAAVESGSMLLTPNLGSQTGSVIFDQVSTEPVEEFVISFDFYAGPGDGADGFSFALLDTAVHSSSDTWSESGAGAGSLSVCFDLYDNGSEIQVGGNYVAIRLDDTVITSAVPSFTMEATGWHHAEITFVGGKLTMVLKPEGGTEETLFDAVDVPGFTPFAALYGFSARTGGSMNEHRVDNVQIGKTDRAYNPSPDDGEWLRFAPTKLSWKLPESLTGGTVTCDVIWYSGDPNEQGTTSELLVTGAAVESVALEGRADALKDYWWQVDCYDPNLPGTPIKIDGPLWMFTTNRDTPMVFIDETDGGTVVAEQGETSDTYNVSLSSSPASPVTITTYSTVGGVPLAPVPVVDGADDAEEDMAASASGTMDVGSSDLELGMDGSEDQIVGVRFRDIQLPPGTVITSARVAFTNDVGSGNEDENVYVTIYGRLTDPGLFTSDPYNLSTPTIDDETTAEVEWTMLTADASSIWTDGQATEASTSPNLAAIVQEIIDQPSWAAGNALVLLFENGNSQGKSAADAQRRAESYNGNSALAPVLHIEYAAAASPGDQVTTDQTVVVLDSSNWEAGVAVTVTAIDDDVLETDPHTATLINRVTSADPAWNYLAANPVVVSINDNECGTWGFSPYDFDENCYVDMGDLKMLALEWLTCSTPNTGYCVDQR